MSGLDEPPTLSKRCLPRACGKLRGGVRIPDPTQNQGDSKLSKLFEQPLPGRRLLVDMALTGHLLAGFTPSIPPAGQATPLATSGDPALRTRGLPEWRQRTT